MKITSLIFSFLLSMFILNTAIAQDYEVIEDFEGIDFIPINEMANGWIEQDDDVESFEVVDNPAPDAHNDSETVLKFNRAEDGDPWAGFWSELPEAIDMTEKKYIHVQLWKPRESPVKFKVEGSDETEDLEIESMEPQEKTAEWESLVFDFGEHDATGEYSIIALMPDFEDPVELEEEIEIYIDNIILSDSQEFPLEAEDTYEATFNVDMTDAVVEQDDADDIEFNPEVHDVYITGTFADWTTPGDNPDYMLEEHGEDENTYTINLDVKGGDHEYKYFLVEDDPTWDLGEWDGDPDRQITVEEDTELNNTWGDQDEAVSVDEIGDAPQAFELKQNYPNPFNPTTNIQYTVPESAEVTLKVYNVLGQEIATLVDQHQSAGQYETTFDGIGHSSGTYIYRLEAGEFSESRTMMFIK